jgi:hypothetical protein
MTFKERVLYHQIHPAKLAADIGGSFVSTYLMWRQELMPAMLAAFVPAIVASAIVLWFADLRRLQQSALGRYIHGFMSRSIEASRFGGQIVMWLGAWYHQVWLIPAGLGIVIAAWMSGLWHKRSPSADLTPPPDRHGT